MAIKYVNGSMYDSLQAQAVSLIQRPTSTEQLVPSEPTRSDYQPFDEKMPEKIDDMLRPDGTRKSEIGFLGPQTSDSGNIMTEYSVGVEIDGKEMDVPTLIPGLTEDELNVLKTEPDPNNIPKAIINKARDHAVQRIKEGQSPFYQEGEARTFGVGKPEEKIMSETKYERPASQDMRDYKDFIIKEEGLKTEAYKPDPSEEFYTIGVGHYGSDVKEGQVITNKEADKLLEDDINKRLPAIRKAIPNFDDMPIEVRKHILGSWFRGSLSGSPKTLRLINEGKFEEAAKEFLDNNEYRTTKLPGVKRRMEATAKAIASLSL
jgi:GH24 family phage-related lysozyme (muramidase)